MGSQRELRPIFFYERIPVPVAVSAAAVDLPRRILLITDQPRLADTLAQMPGFERSEVCCLAPGASTDEKRVAEIVPDEVDLLLVAGDLRGVPPNALLDLDSEPTAVLDLAFLVVRHLNERIAAGRILLLSLHLNAWPADTLHPDAAIVHGMLKSLARDWPDAVVRAVATDSSDLAAGAAALEQEMALSSPDPGAELPDVQNVELGGRRHPLRFSPPAMLRAEHD